MGIGQRKNWVRILSFIICAGMLLSSIQVIPVHAANAAPTAYTLTQADIDAMENLYVANRGADVPFYAPQSNNNCVNLSNRSLLRRRAYLEQRNENWKYIAGGSTKQNIPKADININLYQYRDNETAKHIKEHGGSLTEWLKDLLKTHPEGCVFYIINTGHPDPKNGWDYQHAITITDYTDGHFYCVDPSDVKWKNRGREKLDDSFLITSGHYSSNLKTTVKDMFSGIENGDGDFRVSIVSSTSHPNVAPLHNHIYSYVRQGACLTCNDVYDWGAHPAPFTTGKYKATQKIYLRETPYSVGKQITTAASGTSNIMVDGAYYNCSNIIWYHVTLPNGKSGMVTAKKLSLEKAMEPAAKLKVTALDIPSNLTVGKPFSIGGTVSTENASILQIRGFFTDSNGNELSNPQSTVWVNVNSGYYSLRGSSVDKKILFNKLSAGTYKWGIEFKTDKPIQGKTTHKYLSSEFRVGGNQTTPSAPKVVSPTIEFTNAFPGGYKCTITQNTAGATLFYSKDGSYYVTTTDRSVTFDVYRTQTVYAYSNTLANQVSKTVYVNTTSTPVINSMQSGNTAYVYIYADSGSTIYYHSGSGGYKVYTGAFQVAGNTYISAYATKPGCTSSGTTGRNVTLSAPRVQALHLDTEKDIAEGDAISVHWNRDDLAAYYDVKIQKDGEIFKQFQTKDSQIAVSTEGVGDYTVSVDAVNNIGTVHYANEIKVTTHEPVEVTFMVDDTVYSTQMVKYGYSAEKPATPVKRGHTFTGWVGSYTHVTKPTTIKAEFQINTYTVRFYDVTGTKILGYQNVKFGESIDSAAMESKVELANGGRIFAGWHIFYAKDDSYMDLSSVDSDMYVQAVTKWGNEDLPIYIDDVRVSVSYGETSNIFNGYKVNCRVSTTDSQDIKAKLIISLLSETEKGSGIYKMVAVATDIVHLTADSSNLDWSGLVTYDGVHKADRVEISAVSIEGSDRTGGMIAEIKGVDITDEATSHYSEEWISEEQLLASGHSTTEENLIVKEQKRGYEDYLKEVYFEEGYRDGNFTMSGYTYGGLVYRSTNYFKEGIPAKNWYYFYRKEQGYTEWVDWTAETPATTRASVLYCAWKRDNEVHVIGDGYRIEVENKHGFIESRNLYRVPILDGSKLTTDASGSLREVSGSLNDADLAGKKATIMVYRSKNADPTESQLEYVGQTTLGENGSYSFQFVTKEEPSFDTNDFVVSLAIEGADNLLNISIIPYDKKDYTVEFYGWDDKLLDVQYVTEGKAVEVPSFMEIKGYDFIGWSQDLSAVTRDMKVYAKYKPQEYALAFVDYQNQKTTLTRGNYGEAVAVPSTLQNLICEGYTFKGWAMEDGTMVTDETLVNRDMILIAQWTPKEYKVEFLKADGTVLETQTVLYGEAATLPAALEVSEDQTFLGWSNDTGWWNVTEDIQVKPIIVYNKTVTVTSNMSGREYGSDTVLELYAEEGAKIYYTLNEDEPDAENSRGTTYLYEGPIEISETSIITAIAVKPGYESAESIAIEYIYSDEIDDNHTYGTAIEIADKTIKASAGDEIAISFDLIKDVPLKGAMFLLEYDMTVMGLAYDPDEEVSKLYAGNICDENGVIQAYLYENGDGLIVEWVGEKAAEHTGNLLTLHMELADDAYDDEYAMTISYLTESTYDAENLPLIEKDCFSVDITKDGEQIYTQSGIEVAEIDDQLYTGSKITPNVIVRDGGVLLVLNRDYTVSYKNNVNVNNAADAEVAPTVIIKGKGNYSEVLEKTFKIIAPDVASDLFSCDNLYSKVNGKEQKLVPALTYGKKKLKANKDFTVTYLNLEGETAVPNQAGEYIARVQGIGNYRGTRDVRMCLTAHSPINKATVAAIPAQDYTGNAIEPTLKVTVDGVELKLDQDYKVTYFNQIDAGKATAFIEGIGEYAGEKTVNYVIKGISIKKAVVTGITNQEFAGKAIIQNTIVMLDGKQLKENQDYRVEYRNNFSVGKATVTYVGIGQYEGSVVKNFKITPRDLTAIKDTLKISVYDVDGTRITEAPFIVSYTKGGSTPKLVVVDSKTGKSLNAGKDYTVRYKNNAKTGLDSLVILSGKGNYKGKLEFHYTSTKQNISNLKISVPDVAYSVKKGAFKSSFTITDLNGKKLVAGKDYDKNQIVYSYADDTELDNGTLRVKDETVADTDLVPAGTKLNVKVKGINEYEGEITASFRVVAYSLAKAKIVTKDKVFTGNEITLDPSQDELRVVVGSRKLVYGEDYVITGYTGNRNKGTAKVTIQGIGNYGGIVTATFKIGTRNFLWWVM